MENFDEIVFTDKGIFSFSNEHTIIGTVEVLDDIIDIQLFLN